MKRIFLALFLLLASVSPSYGTLNEVTARASFSGNGSTTSFAYSWRIIDDDDIKVILVSSAGVATTKTKTTHYTVSGTGDAGGGNVVFVTAPASGETVVLLRLQPIVQSTDYSLTTPAETVERDFDKLAMIAQMHAEKLTRALKFAEKSSQTNIDFPDPSASKCIAWTAAATALENVDCETAEGGTDTFTALTDTPSSYTSQALKWLRVNAGETAVEFASTLGGAALIGNTTAAGALILQATSGAGVGSETIKFLGGNNGATEWGRVIGGRLLWGTTLATGADTGDIVIGNTDGVQFVNAAGTTSADYGIQSDSSNNLSSRVPAATGAQGFYFGGTEFVRLKGENGGGGMVFLTESSADHTAPSANSAVIYAKDNGSAKTTLCARFATGAVQCFATEP